MSKLLIGNGCGYSLSSWVRAGHNGHRPPMLTRLEMQYKTMWFEYFNKAQLVAHPKALTSEPRFIMGFWRSGTTLLHNLIHSHAVCRTPLNWECFRPTTFRLQKELPPHREALRPMDEGIITTLSPQEDEFALLLLGEPSVYRAFLYPSAFASIVRETVEDRDFVYTLWLRFITQVAATSKNPLLLKSPNHLLRLDFIDQLFPGSKQLWIYRNFKDVFRSNIQMWKAMASMHAIGEWNDGDIFAGVLELAVAYRQLLNGLIDGRSRPMAWVSYDQLRDQPMYIIEKALRHLDLQKSESGPVDANIADIRKNSSLGDTPASDHYWQKNRENIEEICLDIDRNHVILSGRYPI